MPEEPRPEQIVDPDQIKAYYMEPDVVLEYERKRFSGVDYLKQANETRAVLWTLAQSARGPVVEVASGTGRLARAAARGGHAVVCLDYSLPMLWHSRERARASSEQPAGWVRADAFRLPLPDESVPAVICFRFIRHFERPERNRLWGELHRILAPGGWLALDVANAAWHTDRDRRFIYDQAYTLASFRGEAAEHGFRLMRVFGNGYTFLSRRPLRPLWRCRQMVRARSWTETVALSRLRCLHAKAYLWSVACQKC